MARLALTLLGGFQARLGTGPPLTLPTKKAQAFLAYLALARGREHSRDKLAALLWGDLSQGHARNSLRQALFAIRKAVEPVQPPCLCVEAATISLDADAVDVDARTFERLVGEGTPEALQQAAELYRGDLLDGLTLQEPPFEEWLMAERERLRELAIEALGGLLASQRAAGGLDPALQTALRLIVLDPLQEPVHRTLMRLYASLGRRGSALRQYQTCVAVLQRELGVEPESDTRQLYEEILRQRPRRGLDAGAIRTVSGTDFLPVPPVIGPMPTPLIGRDEDLTWLRDALARARAEAGQLAVIVGDAGIGKTRLIGEIAMEALHLGARLVLSHCYDGEQILPFGPWVDALKTSGVTEDRALLGEMSPRWRAALARLLPEVDIPGLPDVGDNQRWLFESVTQLVDRLAVRQPLLLVLEDLHWADEMSLRLLAFVTRRIDTWRVLLIATAREQELADASTAYRTLQELAALPHAGRLTLMPLSRVDTRRLTHALVRVGSEARALALLEEQVWAASEGNPFVAVETTRALQEGTILEDAKTLSLPHRVREVIRSRLERLSDRARALASVAAVIGREFDFQLLQQAGGLDEHTTAETVEELVRRQVLRGAGERFDFSHHRVQAVVYDQQLLPQRRLRHRRVGEAIEALHAGSLEPHYLALGIHFREGQVWEKAVDFFRRAGLRATARSASRDAVACFSQARDAAEHLDGGLDSIRLAIDLRLDVQGGYVLLGDHVQMLTSLREAESLAQTIGDRSRLARVWAHMTAHCSWTGQFESAVNYSQRALAIAKDEADRSLEVFASSRLASSYLYLGQYRQAIDLLRPYTKALGADVAREAVEPVTLPGIYLYVAVSSASLGDFLTAAAASREAMEAATRADHPYSLALGQFGEGRWRAVQGNVSEALPWLERSLDACRREGFYLVSTVAAVTGLSYARLGRLANGVALLEESAEPETAIGFTGNRSANLAMLAEGYLLSERLDDALRAASLSLDVSRARQERGYETEGLWMLGEVCSRLEPPDVQRAEHSYRWSLALAEELGMRPLAARCHLGLGRLYRQAGQRAAAKEHLNTAGAMLAQMEMRFWLEQAEAELTLL